MNNKDNSDDYMLIYRPTSEIVNTRLHKCGEKWERHNLNEMHEWMLADESPTCKVTSHLLKSKNSDNCVTQTLKNISDDTGVSISHTQRIIKKLIDKKLLKKINNGLYMVSPSVSRYADEFIGAKLWDKWSRHT